MATVTVLGPAFWAVHLGRPSGRPLASCSRSGILGTGSARFLHNKPKPKQPENYNTGMQAKSILYIQRLKGYIQDKANNCPEHCSVNYKIEISRAVSVFMYTIP